MNGPPDSSRAGKPPAVLAREFLFESAPFPECHASTIVETGRGLLAAWFGGEHEKSPDVCIWTARRVADRWTEPARVADGIQADGTRFPCWNPVLFRPEEGRLLLFYRVGPSPREWWAMLMESDDEGMTWHPARRLPEGIYGPIRCKPVRLPDGTLLCPSSTEHEGWRIHFERTPDGGRTWSRIVPDDDGERFGAIQPTLLLHRDGEIQALCRTRRGRITEIRSHDGGRTWGRMRATTLPNPNSGIDAVGLPDGRFLLVYNHAERGRTPLNTAVGSDGSRWTPGPVLEDRPGEFSYPAAIVVRDGRVHITYTWNRRRIRHVVLDPGAPG